MKYDIPEDVSVYCTDRDQTHSAMIIRETVERINVEMEGIPMTFHKHKPGVYVCNMSGLEFIIRR